MSRFIEVSTIKPELWSTLSKQYTGSVYAYAKFIPRGFFLTPILPEGNKLQIAVESIKTNSRVATTSLVPPWKKLL